MKEVRLSIQNLSKSFSTPVLKDVDLSIMRGEIHAIVGENGAGKSTLVNILAGLLPKDGGEIRLDGIEYEPRRPGDGFDAGVSFAAQELSIIGTLTVAENIALRNIPRGKFVIDRERLDQQAQSLLKRVGLDGIRTDTIAEKLSLADQQLVELAKALSLDCRVLILDEPTSALTTTQANRLHEIITNLAAASTSVIYISHRLDDVLSIADTVSVLRDGAIVTTAPADTLPVSEIIELMTGRVNGEADIATTVNGREEPVLQIEELTTSDLPHSVSFTCFEGEIVGIAGLAGSGRSALLEAMFGLTRLAGGTVSRYISGKKLTIRNASHAVSLGLGFLPKDRKSLGIFSGQSILANMTLPGIDRISSTRGVIDRNLEIAAGEKLIRQLAIKCSGLDQDIDQLSGGNQQKALIGRWLHCDSDILLLDEPTRGIDVGTKEAIYSLLLDLQSRNRTILMVSSEIEELMRVCSRILVLSDRKLVREFKRGEWSQTEILAAAFQELTASVSGDSRTGALPGVQQH